METAGLLGEVDQIVGTSAGSFSAAYFIGGAAVRGAAGYWRVLPGFVGQGRFFSPWRALTGHAMLDIPAVVDEVFSQSNPIPWDAVIASAHNQRGAFAIQALDADSGEIVLLRRFRTEGALKAAIKGSCWLPLLAGLEPFRMPGQVLAELEVVDRSFRPLTPTRLSLFDGSVADYYLLQTREGIAPLLSICCDPLHPCDYDGYPPPLGRRLAPLERLAAPLLFRRYPKAVATYVRHMLSDERRRQSAWIAEHAAGACSEILYVHPCERTLISRNEVRPGVYRSAVLAGWKSACAALDIAPVPPADWDREG